MSSYLNARRARNIPEAPIVDDETAVVLGLVPYGYDFAWAAVEVDRIFAQICEVRATGYVEALRSQSSAALQRYPALQLERRRHLKLQALVDTYHIDWIASAKPEPADIGTAYHGGTFDGILAAMCLPVVQVSRTEMYKISNHSEWKALYRHQYGRGQYGRGQTAGPYARPDQHRHRPTSPGPRQKWYERTLPPIGDPLLVITTALRKAPI